MASTTPVFDDFLRDYATVLRYMNEHITAPLNEYHLTFDTFLIMHEIGTSHEPLLLMDIANDHHVSRSAISRQISILLKYDYVYQVSNPHDRRQKSLLLTDRGKEIDQTLITVIQKIFSQWTRQLGKRRINSLLSLLGDFTQQIVTPSYDQPTDPHENA
ncbi:MarR family transcriptional regulator [Lactiplantibacillus garii]|uniref:MarR family transcriptional regulator n=1 Tax=Lactiplantibacillus garii TaxID=2306423 RepID=A0A426D4D1_9LACO|nr:winged helix DNA-binding protein [Lactiplantibacillus garii]RRK09414.1 MarR family transcriptional regulator [Lactiplantibacillus garii]